jgi:transposase
MAYKTGNRYQMSMLPISIEEYVGKNDPVRAYDSFVEVLDFDKLGIRITEKKEGSPEYNPKAMLKLLIYGYSYGWRSSRKLERATHHDLSFIWLMGGLKPDHKTISRFRKNNKEAIIKVMKQCARICIEIDLIEGNTLFLDGTKMRGNASINQTRSKEYLKKELENIDKTIEKILNECEKTDESEKSSLVEMPKQLNEEKTLKTTIEKLIKTMEDKGKETINLTDEECAIMKGRQGTHAGSNAQIVVDEKHGLIVSVDVVTDNNDLNQFSKQVDKANEVLGKNCKTACSDAGYSNVKDLEKTVEKSIEVIVPNQKQAAHKSKEEPFSKEQFIFDEEKNIYMCPEEKELKKIGHDKTNKEYKYQISNRSDCLNCKNYGICTTDKNGRSIKRSEFEKTKEDLAKLYLTEKGQAVYKKRKTKVELPFGHIKRNLNGGYFLLRGLDGANAEMSINCTCFNVVRMITILGGVRPFINKLIGIR